MLYITVDQLLSYKTWFDLSWYSNIELETYIWIASDLINDYIWYSFNYDAVVDEQWQAIIQKDWQLFITLKWTNINAVTSLKANTYWSNYTTIPIENINLFSKPWYFYLSFSTDFYNTGRRFLSQDKISYKVSYTKLDKWIPALVALATSKIVWNLLRADYNLQNWISWSEKTVQSFTSWDYTVKLWGSSLSYQWKYNAAWWAIDNPYIDDWVKTLLYKFKKTSQNTY